MEPFEYTPYARTGSLDTSFHSPFKGWRVWFLVAALLPVVCFSSPRPTHAADAARRIEVRFEAGTLVWRRGAEPVLTVMPRRGDGWYRLAQRYCGNAGLSRRLARANSGLRAPQRGRPVSVPITTLRADLRLAAVHALFPADGRVRLGWRHWVLAPFGRRSESWDLLAGIFTAGSRRAGRLRRANPELPASAPPRGRPLLIPEAELLSVFRKVPVPTPTPTPTRIPTRRPTASPTPTATVPPPRSISTQPRGGGTRTGALTYGHDSRGDYAVYRLQKGEALYSAVVVRFTGQLHAADVNATAREIAKRSKIQDVSSIPIGYPVKIPLDLLLPEYLPAGHPRRVAWEREQGELARFAESVRATDLSGVHVILDSGHGGVDSGAVRHGVWESVYAYDLLCRIKHDLEQHTRASVWPTILDLSRGQQVVHRDVLPPDRDQVLLTHPRFGLNDTVLGVHLRWYLANDVVHRLRKKGVPASRIVFLSLHADSLHPSVRGAMAYVPSRHLRPRSYRARKRGLSRYREYRDHPEVKLSRKFTTRAEASSRRLAEILIDTIGKEKLEVHPYSPIRGSVLRGRRRWVPAVLRYSLAQNAVLLECCNLSNDEDRRLLLDRNWRERFARAVVRGLARAFGDSDGT